ncbi:hypothetical protein [Synechococcus sp. PCC 7336]|uniref:hypothetical protein n=1 Tax=Synechococcus sp. PCC 7336 TaxID=195250 RepID=UPI0003628E0C|nr:hypothetical protein [Synechococcus sp. PCC 7336]
MIKIDGLNDIISTSFGMWITALFGNIPAYNPGISFGDQKEVFFYILKKLLDEKKIYFEDPKSKFGSRIIWDEDTSTIIQYLLDRWPKSAKDENDVDLNTYFYEIPVILWVGDNGRLYSS